MSDWIQVDITTTTAGIEPVAAVLLDLGLGYSVQDSADFESFLEGKQGHWDYIDDELMKLREAPTVITVYLADKKQGVDQLAAITRELDRLRFIAYDNEWGELSYKLSGVNEEDWASNWKNYYHPIKISQRLTICPEWQEYDKAEDETVVLMNPGMAFGTGSHESTRLCLEFLDEIIKGGETVLDVGCGSGILSVAAILLGAKCGIGSDIDQVAVETAIENSRLNEVADRVSYQKGSFAQGVVGRFDIIFANIVASAIISFSPEVKGLLAQGGHFICSGIIDDRADEVKTALEAAGLEIVAAREDKGWVAYLAQAKN